MKQTSGTMNTCSRSTNGLSGFCLSPCAFERNMFISDRKTMKYRHSGCFPPTLKQLEKIFIQELNNLSNCNLFLNK